MSLLGIDVGTSGCKAVLFGEDGRVLASAYQEYDIQRPQPGWAELDAPDVWQRIRLALAAVAASSRTDPVQALCVSSMGEATVPVTRDRRILGPSLTYSDARGQEYLRSLAAGIGDPALYDINGNALGNHYSLTKLMWTRDHRPDLYAAADKFLHWSSLVAFMLGADAAVDYSLANRTLLFDLETRDWSAELLGWAGLDPSKLPFTVPTGCVVGETGGTSIAEIGLPAGIPIVSGPHDQCANAVGCGVISEDLAMYGMGTVLCAVPVFSKRPDTAAMLARGLNTEHHAVSDTYVSFMFNQGGALLKWYRDTVASVERGQALAEGRDIYASLIAEMPEGPSAVMALPHFSPTGPPQFISDSCGVLAGLTLETTRGEILKGLIEGATFYIRACIESLPGVGIEVDRFHAVGGGTKSDAWVQLSADVLGKPFVRPRITEAGALGAAILAGAAAGAFSSVTEGCSAMVHLDRTFEPVQERVEAYDVRFVEYQRLWPLMADYLRELAKSADREAG